MVVDRVVVGGIGVVLVVVVVVVTSSVVVIFCVVVVIGSVDVVVEGVVAKVVDSVVEMTTFSGDSDEFLLISTVVAFSSG